MSNKPLKKHNVRIDTLLIDREIVGSRKLAQSYIISGNVLVNDKVVDKPGHKVSEDCDIRLKKPVEEEFVSRGGKKLKGAIESFRIDVTGLTVLDAGASTGGFTDCLLQHGAARVYAIDVGYGQLAWRLRRDSRVVVMERVNARYLRELPEPVDLATLDVSFISLTLVLPAVMQILKPEGQIISLIKPQFEAGPDQVGKGGVVKDPSVHHAVLCNVLDWAVANGLRANRVIASPLRGPAGNVEFFAHLTLGIPQPGPALHAMVDDCLASLSADPG